MYRSFAGQYPNKEGWREACGRVRVCTGSGAVTHQRLKPKRGGCRRRGLKYRETRTMSFAAAAQRHSVPRSPPAAASACLQSWLWSHCTPSSTAETCAPQPSIGITKKVGGGNVNITKGTYKHTQATTPSRGHTQICKAWHVHRHDEELGPRHPRVFDGLLARA